MSSGHVFKSHLPGRWYPAKADELRALLEGLRPDPAPEVVAGVCAAVVPHAGYLYSGRIAAGVFARLDRSAYDRVIVLAPSHHAALPNRASLLRVSGYATPLGTSPADTPWIARAHRDLTLLALEEAHREEHGDQIQVPLIQHFLGPRMPIACLVLGQFDPDARAAFAGALRALLDRRTLVVASTDFTHFGPFYGYVPFTGHAATVASQLRNLDDAVFAAFASRDPVKLREVLEVTGATVCGKEVLFQILALQPSCARIVKTGYIASGDITKDWTNSVGYAGAVVFGAWNGQDGAADTLSDEDGRRLLAIAREVVAFAAQHGCAPPAARFEALVTPPLRRVSGAFVTLTRNGRLRGCIGEMQPARPVWQAVHDHARNAAVLDSRFGPVRPEEVPALRIEVSVLTPPTPVAAWMDIAVGRHGVVLHKAGGTAVFLPQVATENGWDRPTMLRHLALKAGLHADDWMVGATFDVFEAQVFREPDAPRHSDIAAV